jgi:hypothetical protein
MVNHQSSQFEMRNRHGLTLILMTFSFRHSLKTSKQSKLLIKNVQIVSKNLQLTRDRLTKPPQITYH